MVMTAEKINYYFQNYVRKQKCIELVITKNCNDHCSHCYMNANNEEKSIMNKKIIKKIFSQIDNSWVVTIIGGEPLLYPKTVKYIGKLCLKKKINLEIATNGFWGNNKKIINLIKRIKPKVINFGLDSFHSIDYKILLNLVNEFKDNPDIDIMYETVEGFDHPMQNLFKDVYYFYSKLAKEGRSDKTSLNLTGPIFYYCQSRGLEIYPNGDIFALCEHRNSCYLGNIQNQEINNLRKIYLNRIPTYFIEKEIKIPYQFNLCENQKLNSEWDTKKIKNIS